MITNAIRKLNVSTLLDHTTVLANLDLKATDITADVSVASYLNTFQGHNVSFGSCPSVVLLVAILVVSWLLKVVLGKLNKKLGTED